jgi:hypothetical protein
MAQGSQQQFHTARNKRHPDEDAAVLQRFQETVQKGMPITRQAVQVKATQTAKSLAITNCKAVPG